MSFSYYDTTDVKGALLDKYESKAQKQDDAILSFFKKHPTESFTPYQVARELKLSCPDSSIKRAITNLTNAGKLVKQMNEQRKEKYGRNNCTWRLHYSQYKQSTLF